MRILPVILVSLVAAGVARAQCPDGSLPPCGPARPAFDADVVAIAPFDVLVPGLALWREGLVDVLSRRLDGAGPLRAVSASVVIRGWSGRADPASARRLGRRTRAQFAVFGELVGAGADSVRASVGVLDVVTGRVTGTMEVQNSSSRMDLLADTLTIRLLGVLGRSRGVGVLRAADFDTRSLPALKAFLEGEQLFRRAMHDSAAVLYGRAIALDSGFLQARRRLSWTTQWRCSGDDAPDFSLLDDVLLRIATARGLSTRDIVSLQVDSLFAAYSSTSGWDSARVALVGRMAAATERAVTAFPRDAEFWHLRGEALEQVKPQTAALRGMALAAYERAVTEDAGLAPPFEDAAELAAKRGDYALSRRLLQAYVRAGASGDCAAAASLFADLLPGGLAGAARERRLREAPAAQLWKVARVFAQVLDPEETAVALNRVALDRRLPPFRTNDTLWFLRHGLATSLSFRGRLGAADSAAPGDVFLMLNRMFVGAIAPNALPTSGPWGVDQAPLGGNQLGLWLVERLAHARDTVSLDRLAQRTDSMLFGTTLPAAGERPGQTEQVRKTLAYAAAFIRSARLLAAGDTNAAIQGLTALPDDACYGCFQHVPLLARVLTSLSRYESAALYYRRDLRYNPDARHVFWAFERATVLERIHDRAGAVENYQFVVDAWRHPDAELAGYVKQARQGLRRLR